MSWGKPRQRSRNLVAPGAVVLIGLLAADCGKPPQAPPPAPPEVTVAIPVVRDVPTMWEFTGTTQAVETVDITARVPGFLEKVAFKPNAMVEKGELLFVIERGPYIAQRDGAAAGLKSAEANLKRAESDLERLQEAVKTNAVSQQEVTRALAERDQAAASLLVAQAALRTAAIELDYTTVDSPIAGIVSRRLVDVGNMVGTGSGTKLTTVRQIDPIYTYFEITERHIARRLGNRHGLEPEEEQEEQERTVVTLALEETGYEVEGYLDYVDTAVDPATGTIVVRAIFPNPGGILLPGFYVKVRAAGEVAEDAVVIDERAVSTDLGGKYVLLVGDDNVVEQRYVELGQAQDDGTVVVVKGLEGKERYIVDGLLRARPGLPVTPQTATAGS